MAGTHVRLRLQDGRAETPWLSTRRIKCSDEKRLGLQPASHKPSDARFQKGSRSLNVSQFKATGRPENVLCLGPDLADGPGQARG